MNAVTAAANGLADGLTAAGLKTHGEIPEKATAPFRYVLLAGVTTGQQFGSWQVQLRVVCVAKPGTNVVTAERVMDLAIGVVNAIADLDGYEVAADAIDEPAEYQANGQATLAAAVNVTAHLSRTQMKG